MTDAGWTREKPTVAGWYWWRNKKLHFGEQICRLKFYKNKLFVYFMEGERYDLDIMKDGEFIGPITPTDRQQGKVEGLREAVEIVKANSDVKKAVEIIRLHALAQAAQDAKGVGE